MQKSLSNSLILILLAAVFFAATLVNNQVFKGFSLDLTENKVYSLSEGTKTILSEIEEPINLYFFFSDTSSKGMTGLRNYAVQVETLLKKYVEISDGMLKLEIIDPEPFSEAEDRAASFGLTAAGTGMGDESIYFGLAGTNSLDDAMIIGFFDPSKESFLEYDLSKLIHQLNNPEAPKLSIVTSLSLEGGQNPLNGQIDPANVAYTQLTQLFDVEIVSAEAIELPSNTQVLLLWHPKNLSEDLLFAIDQYLMQGGNAIAFVDPHYESDQMAMMGGMGANSSDLPLLASYGIEIDLNSIVLDAQLGLEVRAPQGGVIRHLGFLGLNEQQINKDDITTADLDTLNGASFASISLAANSELNGLPLLTSSNNTATISSMLYAMQRDPTGLLDNLNLEDNQHTLAMRITGPVQSHFSDKEQAASEGFIAESSALNLVVFSDADILADRFWVQQSSFFGQTVFNPFANNGDMLINIAENYGGSEGLIGIRSRGTFARPFIRVQELAVVAEEKFRQQEQLLQQELEQTEAQLAQLQSQQSDSLTLSPEQQAAVEEFMNKRIDIRKSLRDVQFQLDKDIDALGNNLAIINIAIAPLLLVLCLYAIARISRRRAKVSI